MSVRILQGDCREVLRTLPDESVHCVVTSPPYWGLRDYGMTGQLGLEPSPAEYVADLVAIMGEVRRVLRADGTCWLNLGDSYATGAGRVGNAPGGGAQGERWSRRVELGTTSQFKDRKIAGIGPMTQPNRMPQLGLKSKDLVGIPWRVAFALQADGWWLRQDIIWSKPNPMPESVTDRCTKAHEYLFLLSKNGERPLLWWHRDSKQYATAKPAPDYVWRNKTTGEELTEPQTEEQWTRINLWSGADYYFDTDAIAEPVAPASVERLSQPSLSDQAGSDRVPFKTNGTMKAVGGVLTRNKRSVWTVATQPFSEAHFATFPPALIEPCILAGCPGGGLVLDPFGGAGTTGLVADRLGRDAILIEINPAYAEMARRRIEKDAGLFAKVAAQ